MRKPSVPASMKLAIASESLIQIIEAKDLTAFNKITKAQRLIKILRHLIKEVKEENTTN